MNIYIDCEFNGFGGELISMALVAEDGKEWYGVLPPLAVDSYDSWVKENVLPFLRRSEATANFPSLEEFRESFRSFMIQFDEPVIVSDWYTDLHHFLSCFQGRDHTGSFNYSCHMILDMSLSSEDSEVPHNALYDARAIAKSNGEKQ